MSVVSLRDPRRQFLRLLAPPVCGPPVTAFGGSATSGDPQVWRPCVSDAPGTMTAFTNFSGFTQADQCHNPVLSPDGSKILFEILQTSTGFREIWVVDAVPGSTPTQLVADTSNYVVHPAWGPDSDTFVYVHCAGGALLNGTIYKDAVSAPGSPTSLKAASGGYSPFRPQVNFDGSRVAYIWDQNAGALADLRCMDDDGANDSSLDNTIGGNDFNDPPQFSWANTQNVIAYQDGKIGANKVYVIDDTGSGKTQINANGAAAGAAAVISGRAWPADDSFVVITANIGAGYFSVIRAEVDGSTTSSLSSTIGAANQNWFRDALVYNNRIWFIRTTDNTDGVGRIGSMALDGTDERTDFASNAGTGDQVYPFLGGDGFYHN